MIVTSWWLIPQNCVCILTWKHRFVGFFMMDTCVFPHILKGFCWTKIWWLYRPSERRDIQETCTSFAAWCINLLTVAARRCGHYIYTFEVWNRNNLQSKHILTDCYKMKSICFVFLFLITEKSALPPIKEKYIKILPDSILSFSFYFSFAVVYYVTWFLILFIY